MKIACPNCGADIIYDISKQKVHCDHCNQDFDASIMMEATKKYRRYIGYTCSSCGAELAVSEQEQSTRCAYCKSQELIQNELIEELEPDGIIPFKYTKEEFVKNTREYINKRKLAPKEFRDGIDYNSADGIYVPSMIYDIKSDGTAFYESKAQTICFYKYDYDEKVTMFMDANKMIKDDMMRELSPYNLNEIKPFSIGYIAGYSILRNNEDINKLAEKAVSKADEVIQGDILYIKPVKFFPNTKITKQRLVYLPIWFLESKYDDKKYLFYINGVTGKITGDIPIRKKYHKFLTIDFAITIAIAVLLFISVPLLLNNSFSDFYLQFAPIYMQVFLFSVMALLYGITRKYSVNKNAEPQRKIKMKKLKKSKYFAVRELPKLGLEKYRKDIEECERRYNRRNNKNQDTF